MFLKCSFDIEPIECWQLFASGTKTWWRRLAEVQSEHRNREGRRLKLQHLIIVGHWRPVVCEAGVPQVTASAEGWLKETWRVRGLRRHIFHCQRRVCDGLDLGRDVCQSTSLINCRILMCPDRTLHTLRRNQCDSLHPPAVFMLRQTCFFPSLW